MNELLMIIIASTVCLFVGYLAWDSRKEFKQHENRNKVFDDNCINPEVIRKLFSLLIRQEMYLGEVEKGRLTPEQSFELYKIACTSTAVWKLADLPEDQHVSLDSDGIPFSVSNDVKGKIKSLSESYYLPVQKLLGLK